MKSMHAKSLGSVGMNECCCAGIHHHPGRRLQNGCEQRHVRPPAHRNGQQWPLSVTVGRRALSARPATPRRSGDVRMTLLELPTSAAWRHEDARSGFECCFVSRTGDAWVLEGHTAAVERGTAWAVHYTVSVDDQWRTRRARVTSQTAIGSSEVGLEADGEGRWLVDGRRRADLDGCI